MLKSVESYQKPQKLSKISESSMPCGDWCVRHRTLNSPALAVGNWQ